MEKMNIHFIHEHKTKVLLTYYKRKDDQRNFLVKNLEKKNISTKLELDRIAKFTINEDGSVEGNSNYKFKSYLLTLSIAFFANLSVTSLLKGTRVSN